MLGQEEKDVLGFFLSVAFCIGNITQRWAASQRVFISPERIFLMQI